MIMNFNYILVGFRDCRKRKLLGMQIILSILGKNMSVSFKISLIKNSFFLVKMKINRVNRIKRTHEEMKKTILKKPHDLNSSLPLIEDYNEFNSDLSHDMLHPQVRYLIIFS